MNSLNCGWVCPKCGRVMAPFVAECSYCNKEMYKQVSKPVVNKDSCEAKDFVKTKEKPVMKEEKPKVEMYVDDKFVEDLGLDTNLFIDTILKLLNDKIDN